MLTGEGGKGGGAKLYDGEKALSSINYSILYVPIILPIGGTIDDKTNILSLFNVYLCTKSYLLPTCIIWAGEYFTAGTQ